MTKLSSVAAVALMSMTTADASPFTLTRAYVDLLQTMYHDGFYTENVIDTTSPENVFSTPQMWRGVDVDFNSDPATLRTRAYTETFGLPAGMKYYLETQGYLEFATTASFSPQYVEGPGDHVVSTYRITQLATGAFASIDGSSGQSLQFPASPGSYRIDFYAKASGGQSFGYDTLALAVVPEPATAALMLLAAPLLRRRRG